MNVKTEILKLIQKKCSLDKNADITRLNYIEGGYIDSVAIIQFIVQIEDKFNIEFSDEELSSDSFKIVSGLIALVEGKIKAKNAIA